MEEKLVFDTYRSIQKVRASRRHLGILKPGHPLYRKGLQRQAQAAWGPPVDVEADMLLGQCLHRELLGAGGRDSTSPDREDHGKGRRIRQLPQQSRETGTPGLADPFRVCRQTCRLSVRSSGSTSVRAGSLVYSKPYVNLDPVCMHAMLGAVHARRAVFDPAFRPAEVHDAPAPRLYMDMAGASPATYGAAQRLLTVRPREDHDATSPHAGPGHDHLHLSAQRRICSMRSPFCGPRYFW